MPDAPHLEEKVLAALDQALREQRLDVAEHLLRALEALCGEAVPGSPLADAYLAMAGAAAPRRPSSPTAACARVSVSCFWSTA
jgi:Family of unknown function (DUF6103)